MRPRIRTHKLERFERSSRLGGHNMIELNKSVMLNADAAKVWSVVGRFDALPEWHPAIVASKIEEVDGKQRRVLTVTGGGTLVEQLEAIDQEARSYSYSIVEGVLPVEDYHSTISVTATDDDTCLVEWEGRFVAKGTTEAHAAKIIDNIYSTGLDALKTQFHS